MPTSSAVASKKIEEECSQELNGRMHALVGNCEEDWIGLVRLGSQSKVIWCCWPRLA